MFLVAARVTMRLTETIIQEGNERKKKPLAILEAL